MLILTVLCVVLIGFVGYWSAMPKFVTLIDENNPEKMANVVDALDKAGMPTWPYGYEPGESERLDGAAVRALIQGQSWIGRDTSGNEFFQQFTNDGRVALRSRGLLLTGTARIEGDRLCLEFPGAVLGRDDCGYVYRNPKGTSEEHNQYVRVGLRAVYYFSVEP